MSSSTIRLSGPAALVASVPHIVGFTPAESLVLVGIGANRRMTLALRADLDGLPTAAARDYLAASLVKSGAASCAAIIYTDEPGRPHQTLLDEVTASLTAADLVLTDALLVRNGRWWSYLCTKSCCPPEGTPLDDTSEQVSRLQVESIAAGQRVLGSREELVASIAPGDNLLDCVPFQQGLLDDALNDPKGGARRRLARISTLVRDPRTATDDDLAGFAVGLFMTPVRDQVIKLALTNNDGLLTLCLATATRIPADLAEPLCTVLAISAYCSGNGALAQVALDRVAPDYPLAALMRAFITSSSTPTALRELIAGL